MTSNEAPRVSRWLKTILGASALRVERTRLEVGQMNKSLDELKQGLRDRDRT